MVAGRADLVRVMVMVRVKVRVRVRVKVRVRVRVRGPQVRDRARVRGPHLIAFVEGQHQRVGCGEAVYGHERVGVGAHEGELHDLG